MIANERKVWLCWSGLFLVFFTITYFFHVNILGSENFFGIWRLPTLSKSIEILLTSVSMTVGMTLYISGLHPWDVNRLKKGIKASKFLKTIGYESIIKGNFDFNIIIPIVFGFGFYIKDNEGHISSFRLLIYVILVVLSAYYLFQRKDIIEIKQLYKKGKEFRDGQIDKSLVTDNNMEDTLDRLSKAFTILKNLISKEGWSNPSKEDLNSLEAKYPSETKEILELLNKNSKQDLSVLLTSLDIFTEFSLLRNFKPIEAKNIYILGTILAFATIFIISHIYF